MFARRSSVGRLRPLLGPASRLLLATVTIVALVVPIFAPRETALATHTLSELTPGPANPNQWNGGPTPPAGYGPNQPAQNPLPWNQGQPNPTFDPYTYGQTPTPTIPGYPSMPGQPSGYPGQESVNPGQQQVVPGQQSVPSPPYIGAPGANGSSVPGGVPGSAIVSTSASPMPGGSDPCYGDEVITFSPASPRIGNELLIAVTSSRPHPFGRLTGTEKTTFVRERPGQLGYVWEWTVQPTYPGEHQYVFYVDSTVPCKNVAVRVLQSLSTRTPTPTKAAAPYGWDNGNSNSNNNSNNSNDNYSYNNNPYNYNPGSYYAPTIDPAMYVTAGQDRYGCSDFQSQSNAQRVLRYDPSDPNRLDAEDGYSDGIACSTYTYGAYPNDRDVTAVSRTMPTPTTGVFDPRNYLGQGDRYGCLDFASQAQAQAVLRADPTDPNRLDANPRDGLACGGQEASQDGVAGGFMPPPNDTNRVTRP